MCEYIINIIREREKPIYPQIHTNEKSISESDQTFTVKFPKGQKAVIKEHAENQGESMNQFVIRAINETMERDSNQG